MNQVIQKKRHRLLLDVTFKHGHTATHAMDVFLRAIERIDLSEVQIIRPLPYVKILAVNARMQNSEIRADLETAMDAIREARNKLT